MGLFAADYLNVIDDMVAPTKKNRLSPALVTIGCLYQGQRVIMPEPMVTTMGKGKMVDKAQCDKGQDIALRFVPYLERLPEWEEVVKSTAASHKQLTESLFEIKLDLARHSDTKATLDKLLIAVQHLTENVTIVCTNHDNYQKDMHRVETKQTKMDEVSVKETKNIWIEIGKTRDSLARVETRQTGILALAGRIFPYLMMAVFALFKYGGKP